MHESQKKETIHISYLTALCAVGGVTVDVQRHDEDGTDVIIKKRLIKDNGSFFDAQLRIQLKCTSSNSQYSENNNTISYKLKSKNYNDLCTPCTTPFILGVLILPESENEWIKWSPEDLLIKGRMYWKSFSGLDRTNNTSTITIKISKSNLMTPECILDMLDRIAKGDWV